MCKTKLNLIAAACENMGIGSNGALPWRLKKEMAYFSTMTIKVKDPSKVNAVIMGRRTWECIPPKYKPLSERVNIVLTHNVDVLKEKVPEGVIVVASIDEAISYIEGREDIESTWVIGGSSIYQAAMEHPNCGKIYLTEIQRSFECDTFFPKIPQEVFKQVQVKEDEIPEEKQTEGDISYYFRVYKML
ncbi:dihydrofolate reductase isoform X2 [Plutella xylostella]|uniref:dihydrofolate reductase isoform X2 n=1 Tax=Plutella xylostella TaxID=51655 RepID=UPI002032AEEF|nr:dihydrofolate reductase isoform X2 [Plutella xylostella]